MNPARKLPKSWLFAHAVLLCCASLSLRPGVRAGEFVRGDANLDLQVDLSDAVLTLESLFVRGEPLPCPDAGDSDDSGVLDISDPIRTLGFLFTGGAAPPPPFPAEGFDPSADGLTCLPSTDFEPPRPLEAQEVLDALDGETPELISAVSSAVSVSPQLFDLLTSLAEGASLLDYTDEPGVADFMEAIGERTPEPGSPDTDGAGAGIGTSGKPTCVWVATLEVDPTTQSVITHGWEYDDRGTPARSTSSRPVGVGGDPLSFFDTATGQGPTHHLVVSRSSPNCRTPQTDIKTSGKGYVYLKLEMVCVYRDGFKIVEPGCESFADVEGRYHGSATIKTSAGQKCYGQFNAVEALAQEEAALKVNGDTLFEKSIVLHNGNQIQKQISYQIGTSGLSFGRSQTVSGRTGRRPGELKALGGKRVDIPMYALLEGAGKAELFATGAADGQAMASMQSTALFAFGVSSCAAPCAVLIFGGFKSKRAELLESAKSFYFLQTGNPDAFQELFPGVQ